MKKIGNSGCVSQSTYNALRARDKARSDANNLFDVYLVKKNGDLYKKPFGNQGFRTLEDAITKRDYWQKLKPDSIFAIKAR